MRLIKPIYSIGKIPILDYVKMEIEVYIKNKRPLSNINFEKPLDNKKFEMIPIDFLKDVPLVED